MRFLFCVVVNGIHAADGPTLDAQLAAVSAGFDDQSFGVFFNADNTAADTTDGCDLVADLCFFTHFVFFLSLFGLRTEEDEIQCAEQQSIHENHHNDSAGVSAGLGQKKILIHIVFYTSNRIFQL